MVAIFVLTVFLSVISIDLIVLKLQGKYHPAFEPAFSADDLLVFDMKSLELPSNLFLSKGHTWLRKNSDGLVDIGIDAFGVSALGSLSITSCAQSGDELKRGETIFEGRFGSKKVKFVSPVDGIVKSVNTNFIGQEISDPYGMCGVKMITNDLQTKKELFFAGFEAVNWMKKEFINLKSFIDSHIMVPVPAGVTMYDGGTPTNELPASLDDKSVNEFEKEFLSL